jgi:superfamily II DNA or RNA helicase
VIDTERSFLSPSRLQRLGPKRLLSAAERLLWHLGFDDVRNIDGPGDEGGDILAFRQGVRWVFQSRWTTSPTIDDRAVRQVDAAKAFYGADRAVVVTNARPGRAAILHRQRLGSVGVRVDFWDGEHLAKFGDEIAPTLVPARYALRSYQETAIEAARQALFVNGRALVIMATGLGKTVVAGEVIADRLAHGVKSVLLVAHTTELIAQLERALWRHLPKQMTTSLLSATDRPTDFGGVVCATVQSAASAAEAGWRPDLVVVDEAHHVSEDGMFQRLLDVLDGTPRLGLTATPWRGDGYDIGQRFGTPVFKMGIVEGMAQGFLAEVDYRLFVDGIDWTVVSEASDQGLTVRDLNARLFLPQRDEEVVDHLREAWSGVVAPRAIVFCRTIEHAEEFAASLRAAGWRRAAAISNRQSKRDRAVLMSEFRDGRIPIVTAVDIFNEGVDVPDVNILCFLRVTHSRRIFVQQLGRGLRLTPGKAMVQVLDFVSDVRRLAATLEIQRGLDAIAGGTIERLTLPHARFSFSQPSIGSLLQEWIKDSAALENADEDVRLQFPEGLVPT